jgi:hypothetical protein
LCSVDEQDLIMAQPARGRDDKVRQQSIEAKIRDAYDPLAPRRPLQTRTGTVVHRSGTTHQSPNAWFPVTRADVISARQAAFACGVTFSTWMDWHLVRRNYEADPKVLKRGPWKKVKRGEAARITMGLVMCLKRPGASMLSIADEIDSLGASASECQQHMRQEIAAIFADMCRTLEPRRS